jgi:arylsulfatase A-like enzyme
MSSVPLLFLFLLSCTAFAADRPNFLWLTTEDNAAHWYRLYNPEHGAPMPTIEALAAEGVIFKHAYSNAPVCSTARSTLISGVYGPRTGAIYHRPQMPLTLPQGLKLFPAYLRDAGYYTTNNSKQDYVYQARFVEGVWDASDRSASWRNRAPGQPFFHVQNFFRTHESRLFKKLPAGVPAVTTADAVSLLPYHPDTPLMRDKYVQYLSLNAAVDQQMAATIAQLKADGLYEDTIIFHFGDHGGVLPGSKGYAHNDGLQVALVVYVPEKWRHLLPIDANGQPSAAGTRLDGCVEFVDFAATLLHLAGLDIPEAMDGRPFLGAGITQAQLAKRDTAFGYADRFDEKYDMVRFLRKGRFSYRRNFQPYNFDGLHNAYRYKLDAFREWRELARAGKLTPVQSAFFRPRPAEELYDLHNDPHEVTNLAAHPEFQVVLAELRSTLQAKLRQWPDTGFLPETATLACKGDVSTLANQSVERIARLADIADLQLLDFPKARPHLLEALAASDPLERYWACISCSAFGQAAGELHPQVLKLAQSDRDPLVRARAAEFLGLTRSADPLPYLLTALAQVAHKPVAVNLILNSVVLLQDSYGLNVDPEILATAAWAQHKGLSQKRINYLSTARQRTK